jgi:hypothetical protein
LLPGQEIAEELVRTEAEPTEVESPPAPQTSEVPLTGELHHQPHVFEIESVPEVGRVSSGGLEVIRAAHGWSACAPRKAGGSA